MPDATAVYNWPVPTLTDDPNAPQQITDLANAIEKAVATTIVNGAVANSTSLSGGTWTDLSVVTFTLTVDQPVDIVGWAFFVNTGSGRPVITLRVVDGTTHLFGIGGANMAGTSDSGGAGSANMLSLSTPRYRITLAAGAHTVKLQAWRDTNGIVDVWGARTFSGQLIETTGIQVTYGAGSSDV